MGATMDDKISTKSSCSDEKLLAKASLSHKVLDGALLAMLAVVVLKFGNTKGFIKSFIARLKQFPNIYTPQFDWKKHPMNKCVAMMLALVGMHSVIKVYCIEKKAVARAHKKYHAHKNMWAVAMHGTGSVLEIPMGCLACCYPTQTIFTKMASLLAINNVFSGFVLTPGVFGIKHMTVPGFGVFGALRGLEMFRTIFDDYRNYPQAWILLHVGTVVRLLGWYVLPYSSTDGRRGDLFTEPTMYTFNILLSGYLTAAFVYPPKWVLASLLLYVAWYNKQPPRISMRRRLCYKDVEEQKTKDMYQPDLHIDAI